MSTRRKFLQQTALASAAFTIIPRSVLGKGFIPPSDQLRIAAIGCGGKGSSNILNSFKAGAQIVALCDVDDRRSAEIRKQFPKANYYQDYRKLLEKEHQNIDAVIVSTTDHMHYVQTIAAMQLGKHVYVEKPLTHDIWEARKLTEAEQTYKVVTQMGNQGSSGDGTRYIESVIQEGLLGNIKDIKVWTNRPVWPQGVPLPKGSMPVPKEVNWDLWLGTAPYRSYHEAYMPTRWRGYWDYGTGALGDMGCHLLDVPFRAMGLKYPKAVECSLTNTYEDFFVEKVYPDTPPSSSIIRLEFDSPTGKIELDWLDGGLLPERPDDMPEDIPFGDWGGGVLFIGDQASLICGTYGSNPVVFKNQQKLDVQPTKMPKLVEKGADGHQMQWVNACKEGFGSYTSSPFSSSGPLTEMVLMGNLAIRSALLYTETGNKWSPYQFDGRKKLYWDAQNMKITNFAPANEFIKRDYRTF